MANIQTKWRRAFFLEWRVYRGMNQEQLAQKMGISVPYLSQLETGDRRWNQKWLESGALALNISVGTLIDHLPPSKDQPVEALGLNTIIAIWQELAAADRRRALAMMKSLKELAS